MLLLPPVAYQSRAINYPPDPGAPSCPTRQPHTSGLEPECTACLQPWSSHPKGKHITKECKFCWQQAPGDTASDELDSAEDSDIQSRLTRITQENHTIKAQLSQLTDLVWQLLPQSAQVIPQPADTGNPSLAVVSAKEQAPGSSGATLSLPHTSWSQFKEAVPGESSGDNWRVQLSPLEQPPATAMGTPQPAASAPVTLPVRPAPPPGMHTQPLWASPLSASSPYPVPGSSYQQPAHTMGQPPAQVPATIRGKCSVVST